MAATTEPNPEPEVGLKGFDREYARKLLLIAADKSGIPMALQSKGIQKMADEIYDSGLLLVDARAVAERVARVMDGKDSGELFPFHKKVPV